MLTTSEQLGRQWMCRRFSLTCLSSRLPLHSG